MEDSMADDPFYGMPQDLRAALGPDAPPRRRGAPKLRVRAVSGPRDRWYAVRHLDLTGFELAPEAPALPGHVEIWEGGRMVRTALVVAHPPAGRADGPVRYDFKRVTPARSAPPLDYVPGGDDLGGPRPPG
jgi:hypothetical protein